MTISPRAKPMLPMLLVAALAAIVLAAAGCAGGGDSQAAPSGDFSGCRTPTRVAAFAKEIEAARPLVRRMKRGFGAPGLAVAVAIGGRTVWSEVCGYADVSRRLPVRPETSFRIGSVSKTLTAAAAARLVQHGRLDLDVPIQRYVPSFPVKRHPVNVRGLLAHTAGIRHYERSEALSRSHYNSVTDALRVFADDPLLFKPGTQHSYSSYGFNLAGAGIEAISGRPFGLAVRQLVLTPLGMQQTMVDDGRRRQGWAAAYEVTDQRTATSAPAVDLSNRVPSGGFRASA
jgi:serine beta-lactamase-like protein LACTB, mitochondrial